MDGGFDRSKFKETAREVLMWRDKNDPLTVNLILKSGVAGQLPPDMAWVFPLPSLPEEYREVDQNIFGELNKFFNNRADLPRGAASGIKAKALPGQGIIVHEKQAVGDYEIVPIEITGEGEGGRYLNQWLGSQGYATMPEEIQRPYLKKGATFLAIKIRPKSDSFEIRPLLVRYRSDEMRFPLKFSHDDRTFDMNFYLVHNGDKSGITGVPEAAASGWGFESQTVRELIQECPSLSELLQENRGDTITRIALHGANSELMVRDLPEDPGVQGW